MCYYHGVTVCISRPIGDRAIVFDRLLLLRHCCIDWRLVITHHHYDANRVNGTVFVFLQVSCPVLGKILQPQKTTTDLQQSKTGTAQHRNIKKTITISGRQRLNFQIKRCVWMPAGGGGEGVGLPNLVTDPSRKKGYR